MLDRVQRDAPQHARGRIAPQVGHPSMSRFVHADREQERYDLKNDVNVLEGHSGFVGATLASIVTNSGTLAAQLNLNLKAQRAQRTQRKPQRFPGRAYGSGVDLGAMVLTLIVFAGTPPTT